VAARRSPSVLVFALLTIILAGLGCTPARPSTATSSAPATAASTATAAAPSPSPTAAPAFPVTLTDDEGTAVTIPDEPKRIVSLTPDATETLFVLGVGDRIVGKVQDPANFPPEAASIPEVATFSGVDVEKIVALEPDLVISGGAGLTQGAAVEQLRRAGIPVLVNYPTTIDGALAGMRRLGQAVGVPDVANARAGALKDRLEQLAALAATATEKPRLFYEIDVTGGIFTPPADSIYGEMFRLAGAEPIPATPATASPSRSSSPPIPRSSSWATAHTA
jgi:iron complex transport system substrate-binding protein